jgi:hypothetical protein
MRPALLIPVSTNSSILARGLMLRWIVLLIVFVSASIGLLKSPVGAHVRGWMVTAAGLAFMAGWWLNYVLAARRLARANYRLCLGCRNPLPGTSDEGCCPACDRQYDLPEIREEFEAPLGGPAHRPDLIRRYRRVLAVGGIMLNVVPVLAILCLEKQFFGAGIIPLLVGGLLIAVPAVVLERRLLSRVRKAELLVCPRCEYSLANSGERGICPECGRPFEIESVRRAWVSCLKQWKMQ